jgi:uncharacterized protein YegJ (DUF2314 family)
MPSSFQNFSTSASSSGGDFSSGKRDIFVLERGLGFYRAVSNKASRRDVSSRLEDCPMWLLATAAHAEAPPPLPPDARFALALFCAPTCGDDVLDALDAGLADVPNRGGFPDAAPKPLRIMGIAGAEFGIPDAAFVELYGVGVDRPDELAKSEEVLLAWFAAPRGDATAVLAKAHAAFAEAARMSGGWVEDLDTQRLYGAKAWATLDPKGPITDWFVVDAGEDGRLVTRGLRRFGDFELVVEDVAADDAADVSYVVNAVAKEIHGDASVPASLPLATAEVKGTATFRTATARDEDPEGPLLRVSFDGELTLAGAPEPEPGPPKSLASKGEPPADGPLAIPVGEPAAAAPVPAAAPATLDEAKAAARERFETTVRDAFAKGLPAGSVVAVKAPFRTSAGGHEYMWVELRRWEGDVLAGVLKNQPVDVPGLQKGAAVTVRLADVYDYVWVKADGTKEGNTTAKFLK